MYVCHKLCTFVRYAFYKRWMVDAKRLLWLSKILIIVAIRSVLVCAVEFSNDSST